MAERSDEAALRYYEHHGADPLPVVLDSVRESGRDADRIEIDDLAGIDEFHALGRPATIALAELAGVDAGMEVIDVGAGLGGPARFLAARYGARVTAVEPTAPFRHACAELNRRAALAELLRTVDGSATDLPVGDASMDLVWMQAVAISVANKRAMANETLRGCAGCAGLARSDPLLQLGGAPPRPRVRRATAYAKQPRHGRSRESAGTAVTQRRQRRLRPGGVSELL